MNQIYYIDEKIGLKRYRRLSEELIFTILFEYQHTAASFLAKIYGVSKATVYNLVNSFEMPKLNIERFEKDDDSPIHIKIDEDHMKLGTRLTNCILMGQEWIQWKKIICQILLVK